MNGRRDRSTRDNWISPVGRFKTVATPFSLPSFPPSSFNRQLKRVHILVYTYKDRERRNFGRDKRKNL